jgi:hypothetical protein
MNNVNKTIAAQRAAQLEAQLTRTPVYIGRESDWLPVGEMDQRSAPQVIPIQKKRKPPKPQATANQNESPPPPDTPTSSTHNSASPEPGSDRPAPHQ